MTSSTLSISIRNNLSGILLKLQLSALILCFYQTSIGQTFVDFKSSGWKYREAYQDVTAIGNGTWKTNAYNDATWASGQAPLGYENTLPATHTLNTWLWPYNVALNGTNTSKTHYFRKTFNVTNPALLSGYKIKTWCDDGLVVYLNNKEVVRLNMPTGTIDSLSLAPTAPANDSIFSETTINLPSDLLTGTNVIAVEVHQYSGSIDRYFDLYIEGILAGGCPSTVNLERQPYLQIATPTSVVVRWKTNELVNSILKYGTDPNNLTNTVTVPNTNTTHIVNLTGLTPNTKYYYSVGYSCNSTNYILASGTQYYYHSMPPSYSTDPLRFWVLGDVCSGDYRQDNVRDAYINHLGSNRLHGMLFGGDNSKFEGYDGKDPALDLTFFPKYPNQFRNIPFWAILGNHDYTYRPYNDSTVASYNAFSFPKLAEAGGIASNSKSFYSFDVGDVHFVMLNPYHADFNVRRTSPIPGCTGGGWDCITPNKNMFMLKFDDAATQVADFNRLHQVKWLKLDLAATTKKWKIVMIHTPPYTKGTHDSDPPASSNSSWDKPDADLKVIRELLVPVLEQYKVDLIVSSHTHSYARSFLMKGVTGTPTKTEFQADRTKLLQSNSGKYTPVPVTKPYIKNSPYNGAVHVVTGNAGRGTPGSAPDVAPGFSHPVMFYSDSTSTLNATGGSVELLINKNRLDVKYLKLDNDAGTAYHVQDEFTIMKDVNKKTTYNYSTAQFHFTASWEGTYNWRILGGANLGIYTKTFSTYPTPLTSTTYIVTDGYNNGAGFLADTFIVNVCPQNLNLSTTINSNAIIQASQSIKATNTNIIAPSATVEYRAGYVEFLPNANGTAFLATPSAGHYFLAVPAGCTPPAGRVAVADLEDVIPPKKVPLKLPMPTIRN